MSPAAVWPDRTLYCAALQSPGTCFDDPNLRGATFARDRRGSVMAWSGGRAIVFRADSPGGSRTAVRFLLADDHDASHRYDLLTRHLSVNALEPFVHTRWVDDGLHIGSAHYPMVLMDWVDGMSLDGFIGDRVGADGAAAEFGQLARTWRRHCRLLVEAEVGHGDIHAGNLLVHRSPGGPAELRLVDYDNVWVPGLHIPRKEAGHPAFQHPGMGSRETGPYVDAFPNTVTYLSLVGLAQDAELWHFHGESDDCLVFHRDDLQSPDTEVWQALLDSRDPQVRALASVTKRWIDGPAGQFDTLDQVLAAADPALAPTSVPLNTWPPRAIAAERRSRAAAEPVGQTWTPTLRTPAPDPAAARSTSRRTVAVVVLLVVLALLAVLAVAVL